MCICIVLYTILPANPVSRRCQHRHLSLSKFATCAGETRFLFSMFKFKHVHFNLRPPMTLSTSILHGRRSDLWWLEKEHCHFSRQARVIFACLEWSCFVCLWGGRVGGHINVLNVPFRYLFSRACGRLFLCFATHFWYYVLDFLVLMLARWWCYALDSLMLNVNTLIVLCPWFSYVDVSTIMMLRCWLWYVDVNTLMMLRSWFSFIGVYTLAMLRSWFSYVDVNMLMWACWCEHVDDATLFFCWC